MSHYLSLIIPIFNLLTVRKFNSQQQSSLEEQQDTKLARLEDYLMADDNQVISNLALYLYG